MLPWLRQCGDLDQGAVLKRAVRMKRFGGVVPEESSIQSREARARRFGTKLVATDGGEPIKLEDR